MDQSNYQETTGSSDYDGANNSSRSIWNNEMDEMDRLMDHYIANDSNRQMEEEYIKNVKLTFKDPNMEAEFCLLKEDTFKSNVLCVFIIWLFTAASLAVMLPKATITIAALTVTSIVLTLCLIVVMANEFPILPDKLIHWSDTFCHCWKDRSIFVVFVITAIALATGVSILSFDRGAISRENRVHHQRVPVPWSNTEKPFRGHSAFGEMEDFVTETTSLTSVDDTSPHAESTSSAPLLPSTGPAETTKATKYEGLASTTTSDLGKDTTGSKPGSGRNPRSVDAKMMEEKMLLSPRDPILIFPLSLEEIINNRNVEASFASSSSSAPPPYNTSRFKGNEYTNHSESKKGEESTIHHTTELENAASSGTQSNVNALWGIKSQSYGDDTSGMDSESVATKSATTSDPSASTNDTHVTKVEASPTEDIIKAAGKGENVGQREALISHTSTHKRTSNLPLQRARRSTAMNNVLEVERLSEREMTTSFRVQSTDDLAPATVDSLLPSPPGRKVLQFSSRRPRRAHLSSAVRNNDYKNSIHPHRHTTGSYRRATEGVVRYHSSRSRYTTWPTWPDLQKTTLVDSTATVHSNDLVNDEDNANSKNTRRNKQFVGNRKHFSRDHHKVEFTTQISPDSETSSTTPSVSSSVLVPNPVDDYVNGNNDDLVILARSRQRRYGEVSTSSGKHAKPVSNNDGQSEPLSSGRDINNNFASSSDKHSEESGLVHDSQTASHRDSTNNGGNGLESGSNNNNNNVSPSNIDQRRVDEPTGSPMSRDSISSDKNINPDSELFSPENYRVSESGGSDESFSPVVGCPDSPHYVVYSWILCMVSLAAFLKLYFMVKAILIALLFVTYVVLIVWPFQPLFMAGDTGGSSPENKIPALYQLLMLIVLFVYIVFSHSRFVEIMSRLDFLWKKQAEHELQDMKETRANNSQLLRNILPDHVAMHFLAAEERRQDELYSQAFDRVGVMFASIPKFIDFYSETRNSGIECIRLLNEIVVDFDELLDERRFSSIEKIKTVASTYMACSGLNPSDQSESGDKDNCQHLCTLVDFALEMKDKLEELNRHAFNNFKLRIGISCGPVVAGVIGARKPCFDVWGNTVNESSRMDTTGIPDSIQVTKDAAQILEKNGFLLEFRGSVLVKGKGEMQTYFVKGRAPSRFRRYEQGSSQNRKSLAAVVFGMVQARRRQTIRGAKGPADILKSPSPKQTRAGSYRRSDNNKEV